MIRQKENSGNYWGYPVFIVLFFLCICAFSDNSYTPVGRALHHTTLADLQSQTTAVNNAHSFPVHKNIFRFSEKENFNLVSCRHRLIAENRSIHHNILFFRQDELHIKPFILQRFHFRIHANDSDDPPVLS